ncbi:hypothetical protein XENTR_v10008806 [Xenopus tropicalis]|nr:hypothetical protein XENTR_v10008806 [Xenopus tropicalis]
MHAYIRKCYNWSALEQSTVHRTLKYFYSLDWENMEHIKSEKDKKVDQRCDAISLKSKYEYLPKEREHWLLFPRSVRLCYRQLHESSMGQILQIQVGEY